MHLSFTFMIEIIVPMPNFSDHNLAIEKNYPPNLKGIQVQTTWKWCFLSPSLFEFGSEGQPWFELGLCGKGLYNTNFLANKAKIYNFLQHCIAQWDGLQAQQF